MAIPTLSATAIMRRPQVEAESGYGRSLLYLKIQQRMWTKPVRIGPRAVGWPAQEVSALCAARIAGFSDDAITALVTKLEASRIHALKAEAISR